MGRSNGPIPIVPDIDNKIRSSVFVGTDAPLVVDVSVFTRTGEYEVGVSQHFTNTREISIHLWVPS